MSRTRKLRTVAWGIGFALMGVGEHAGPSVVLADAPEPQLVNRGSETKAPGKASHLRRSAADKFPLYFVENKGQIDARVAYYVQGKNQVIYFTPDGLTLVLNDGFRNKPQYASVNENTFTAEGSIGEPAPLSPRRLAVKLDFVGADARVGPRAEEPTPALISYFVGPETEWKTGLRTYRRLVYRDLWPGIDLVYSGTVQRLKYMFVVHPGADPDRIQLRYRGADAVSVNERGQLDVQTALGAFQDEKPFAYQEINGHAVDVSVGYGVQPQADSGPYRYGFLLGSYDPALPLIIDPTLLVYAGFIGGLGDDSGNAIAVDGAGNAYITGETNSAQISFPDGNGFGPIPGFDQTQNGAVDAFVAKVNADGTDLIYASFIGGSGDDRGRGIALRPGESGCPPACSVYIVGETNSTEITFPNRIGPDLTHNVGVDAFVVKLNATGTALVYAGYVGGSGDDLGLGIAVDSAGNAYITGATNSVQTSFPDGNGFGPIPGFDRTLNGGIDAFVAKVKADGSGLDYAGYVGGLENDSGNGIALQPGETGCPPDCSVYIVGETSSDRTTFLDANGFGAVPGFDHTQNGSVDAFVVKVKADASGLDYATYIGGSLDDLGLGIAVDAAGNAYITGATNSGQTSFPDGSGFGAVPGFDHTQNGGVDAFVVKVKADASGLDYATYIGGSLDDLGLGIAVDAAGNAYITGATNSGQTSFPDGSGFGAVPGFDHTQNGGVDAFVVKVKADASGLDYATYVGGSLDDLGLGIAVDSAGSAYITGATNSTETTFPDGNGFGAVPGFDHTQNGGIDAFVAKLNPAGTVLSHATYIGGLGDDRGNGIVVDSGASAYIAGETNSTQATFPDGDGFGTVPSFDQTQNGGVNAFVAKICTVCADLAISGLADKTGIVDSPDPVRVSEDVTYTIRVVNRGPDDATNVSLIVTLPSTVTFQSVLPSAPTCTFTVTTGTVDCSLGNLNNGAEVLIAIVVTTTVKATLRLTASVAADQGDPNISNNKAAERTVATLANLVVTKFQAVKAAIPGTDIVIDDTTTNSGKITAVGPGPAVTRFYLSTDAKFDAGDTFLGSRDVALPLAPKASSPGSTTVTIPLATALGKYFLIAVADADNAVPETQENNKKSRRFEVTRPDLTVTALKAPTTAAPGASIVVEDTTSNKAPVPAGASTTRFYLSTDTLLDGGDTLLVNSRAIGALNAKEKSPGSTMVTIPLATVPGTYFVLAVADADGVGVVVETNEANNVRARKITITP